MVSNEVNPYDSNWARGILLALQYKLVYLGTANPKTIERNRRRNKVASKQRQTNRKNGSGV
ncbi:hypothetical protein SEA_NICEHOUSE_187 [Rhodococcus phage NiceHouse]|nr:hypothetical protein SEA_NICEHOUSE_187 [Rhodococcus phage NiceHouse]